jgi:hypothetical protein
MSGPPNCLFPRQGAGPGDSGTILALPVVSGCGPHCAEHHYAANVRGDKDFPP